MRAKSEDAQILQEAVNARMLRAIEFASVAAELEATDVPADEYLFQQGLITEQQRQELVSAISEESKDNPTICDTGNGSASARKERRSTSSSVPSMGPPRSDEIELAVGADRYEWIEQFAKGGLGSVWKAKDTTIDRRVAIKEILPQAKNDAMTRHRFLVEARITGKLQHPGIVPIYDLGVGEDGSPFYAMRFIEGRTLHDAIKSHYHREDDCPSLRQLLQVFLSVCKTLEYAHDQGYIHRDLKPRNIMLGDYGETLVVDWGLARSIAEADADGKGDETVDIRGKSGRSRSSTAGVRSKGKSGQVVGTPAYMAPEQARGELCELDVQSDVFSLGCILFEILVGKPPFAGEDSKSIIESMASGRSFSRPLHLRRDLPKPMNSICVRATEHQKRDRYPSVRELAEDVERFLAGEKVLSHPESMFERLQRISVKHSKAAIAIGVSLGVFTVATGFAAIQINNARVAERKARTDAVEARRLADDAKDEAVSNLNSAIDAVDTWLIQLSADLEFYPGLSSKRTELLEHARRYYSELAVCESEDRALQDEAARAAIRLGDVCQLLGRHDEANVALDRSIDWFRKQKEQKPNDSDASKFEASKELANALIGRAIVAAKRDEASAVVDVDTLLGEAENTLLACLTIAPSDDSLQYAFARLEIARSRADVESKGIAQLENARRRLVDLVRKENPAARHLALYQSTLFELAQSYLNLGEMDAAEEITREAVRHFDSVIAQSPQRPDFYEGRMTAHILRGNIRRFSRPEEALNDYALAESDYKQLVTALHRGEFHSENLVVANLNRAEILLSKGQLEGLEEILAATSNEVAHLIQLHGQLPRLVRLFAGSKALLANLNIRRGNLREAKVMLSEAVLIFEHLRTGEPTVRSGQEIQVRAYLDLAKLSACEGDMSSAKRYMAKIDSIDASRMKELQAACRCCEALIRIVELSETDLDQATADLAEIETELVPAAMLEPLWSHACEIRLRQ